MPVKGKLVITRHGQTVYNRDRKLTGQHDAPLTDLGEEQARVLGAALREEGVVFDVAYSSTLSRAFNTARLALEASGTHRHLRNEDCSWHIEMRAEILEKHTGDFTGKRVDDPEVLSYGKGKLSMAFPGEGSESQAQVTQRVRDFYETELLPQLEQGKNIFVAAHAGVVIAFDDIFNLDRGGTRVPNAAPLVVEYEDGQVTAMYHVDPAQRKHTPARRIA